MLMELLLVKKVNISIALLSNKIDRVLISLEMKYKNSEITLIMP